MNELQELIREKLKEFDALNYNDLQTAVVDSENLRVRYRLEWNPPIDSQDKIIGMDLEEARLALSWRLNDYVFSNVKKRPLLLVKCQPGLGKTYAAIELAQRLAASGKKVLYLMPTHDHYNTIRGFEHFNGDLWYHWLSYNTDNPDAPDEKMCKYNKPAETWMKKGYPLMSMCDSLCPLYKPICPYRMQSEVPQKIIAGVHEHAITGLSINKFHVVIVDEMPLRAFLNEKIIPQEQLITQNAVGPVADLQLKLYQLSKTTKMWEGRPLMEHIGDLLTDVFAQFEHSQLLPAIPMLSSPDDVENAGYWYLDKLLPLLIPEYKAWENNISNWMTRVIVTKDGIKLLSKGDVWKYLPKRTIVLDATANPYMYRQMFGRDIDHYVPHVRMKGKIHQIVSRYNGISTMTDEEEVTKTAKQMRDVVRAIIHHNNYKNPAVITFMGAKDIFAALVGETMMGHFYGQRGSNQFQDCDALFVIGSPSPPDHATMHDVAMINQERIIPFSAKVLDNGGIVPIRSVALKYYQCWDEKGNQASRYISGFWHDDDLRSMSDARREEEIVQAIHRARPLTRPVDVWLFSSVPTDQPLTFISDDPDEAIGAPSGIHWSHWLKLRWWIEATDKPFGVQELANIAGVAVTTVRNQKWLDAIIKRYPDKFEIASLRPKTAVHVEEG